jgi:hypothetical protein
MAREAEKASQDKDPVSGLKNSEERKKVRVVAHNYDEKRNRVYYVIKVAGEGVARLWVERRTEDPGGRIVARAGIKFFDKELRGLEYSEKHVIEIGAEGDLEEEIRRNGYFREIADRLKGLYPTARYEYDKGIDDAVIEVIAETLATWNATVDVLKRKKRPEGSPLRLDIIPAGIVIYVEPEGMVSSAITISRREVDGKHEVRVKLEFSRKDLERYNVGKKCKAESFEAEKLRSCLKEVEDALKIAYGDYIANMVVNEIIRVLGEWDRVREELGKKARERFEKEAEDTEGVEGRPRELRDSEILEIKDLIKKAYASEENRQALIVGIAMWAAKAGVSPKSAARLLKILVEEAGDKADIRVRGAAVLYAYNKAGVNVDKEELKEILGQTPFGHEAVDEKEVEKITLQQLLERVFGREETIRVLQRLEEIFRCSSPYEDPIFALIDRSLGLYFVNDPRSKRISIWQAKNGSWVEGRVVVGAYVKDLKYIENIYTNDIEWEATWITEENRVFTVRGDIEDHIATLNKYSAVGAQRHVKDAVERIFQAFLKKGKAARQRISSIEGFYIDENRNIATDRDDVVRDEEIDTRRERLRKALEILIEKSKYYDPEMFWIAMKWFAVSPFGFALKIKNRRYIPELVIVGPPGTGKTTLGLTGAAIWGLDVNKYIKSGESMNSAAKIEKALAQWTYPVLVDNASSFFTDERYRELRDMLKNAVEDPVSRWKHYEGKYRSFPAAASIVFTIDSAAVRNMDLAELRRAVIVRTSIKSWSREKMREFTERFGIRGTKTREIEREIGGWIARIVIRNKDILNKDWYDAGEEIWRELFRIAGLEAPREISAKPEEGGEEALRKAYDENKLEVINAINEYIAEILLKYGEKKDLSDKKGLLDRLLIITDRNYPSAIKYDGERVYILEGFIDFLEKKKRVGITSLKDLAELMGWVYKHVHIRRLGINTKAVVIPQEDLEGIEESVNKPQETLDAYIDKGSGE